MREIVIDLSQNSFSCPLLFGGYEGEHKNTKLSIILPSDLLPANIEKEIRYKFVFQTPIGELISSPYISADEITDNKISTILWGQLLKHRGDLIGCVAAVADLSGEEVELIAKTSSFKLKISDSPTGVDIIADTAENRDFISEVTKSYLDTVLNLFVDKDYVDIKLEAALGEHDAFSNALKGHASGTVVSIDDISPIEHTMDVKVSSKNLFDISKVKGRSSSSSGNSVVNNGDGTLTITTTGSFQGAKPNTLRDYAPNLEIGKTYTLSMVTTGSKTLRLVNETIAAPTAITWNIGTPLTITQDILDSTVFWHGDSSTGTATISNIQIEEGTTATDYTPYISDMSTVTLNRCGKNLFSNDISLIKPVSFNSTDGTPRNYYGYEIHLPTGKYRLSATTDASLYVYGTVVRNGVIVNSSSVTNRYNGSESYIIAESNNYTPILYTLEGDGNIIYIYDAIGGHTLEQAEEVFSKVSIQLEVGEEVTGFESSKLIQYTPSVDGTVEGVTSLYSTTNLFTDVSGAIIHCEYNRDINKLPTVSGSVPEELTAKVNKNTADILTHSNLIDENTKSIVNLQNSIFDNDDNILGLEVDFTNNKFTRLCGARGLFPGADFDKFKMYGQRRRCNVDDEGNILNFVGDDKPTSCKMKLYEVAMSPSGNSATFITPLFYILKQTGQSEILIPGTGTLLFTIDGYEPVLVELAPKTPTSVVFKNGTNNITIEITADGRVDETTQSYYYTGKFNCTYVSGTTSNKVLRMDMIVQSGYDESGMHGQVMVYQPKFYYKVEPLSVNGTQLNKCRYYISDKEKSGFKLHPAFYDKNGNEVDYILLSAYEAGYWSNTFGPIMDAADIGYFMYGIRTYEPNYDMLLSIANVQPVSGEGRPLNKEAFNQLAKNRGENWQIENIETVSANQLLMMIEYGQMNMQNVIGNGPTKLHGYSGRNGSVFTGSTQRLGNRTGMATESIRINPGTTSQETLQWDGYVSISYRGVENPWGNIYKFIDGISSNYRNIYLDGQSTGLMITDTLGYIGSFGHTESYDWMFIPYTTTGGDSNAPVGDGVHLAAGETTTFCYGGLYYVDQNSPGWSGPFCIKGIMDNDGSLHNSEIGARLIYIPTSKEV